jgi:hypothetical protein
MGLALGTRLRALKKKIAVKQRLRQTFRLFNVVNAWTRAYDASAAARALESGRPLTTYELHAKSVEHMLHGRDD